LGREERGGGGERGQEEGKGEEEVGWKKVREEGEEGGKRKGEAKGGGRREEGGWRMEEGGGRREEGGGRREEGGKTYSPSSLRDVTSSGVLLVDKDFFSDFKFRCFREGSPLFSSFPLPPFTSFIFLFPSFPPSPPPPPYMDTPPWPNFFGSHAPAEEARLRTAEEKFVAGRGGEIPKVK
jgi:hypothetical protein